jgi:hypothetical protein
MVNRFRPAPFLTEASPGHLMLAHRFEDGR